MEDRSSGPAAFEAKTHPLTAYLHCWLLALFPILSVYADSTSQVTLHDLMVPVAAVVGTTALLSGLAILLRLNAARTGLIISCFILFSFAYAGAIEAARSATGLFTEKHLVANRIFFPLWCLTLAAAAFGIILTRRRLRRVVSFVNLAACILTAIVLIRIGVSTALHHHDRGGSVRDPFSIFTMTEPPSLSLPEDPPDIYFLMFDRYASPSSLREFDDFDIAPFVGFLENHGFHVYDSSLANYLLTHISLASSMNLQYLGERYMGQNFYRTLVERNIATRALRNAGYRYLHIGSWHEPTRRSPQADRILTDPLLLSEFSKALFGMTPYRFFFLQNQEYQQVKHAFSTLESLPGGEGPKFVFAHFISPHPPYVLHADGSLVMPWEPRRTRRKGYLAQVQYINRRLEQLIPILLRESERPPIIILQSDEGPYVFPDGESLTETGLWRRRAGILNALHLPGDGIEPWDGMTPVNTMRLIFNRYFGTDLRYLDDRVYGWPDPPPDGGFPERERSFIFVDITDEVGNTERPDGRSSGR